MPDSISNDKRFCEIMKRSILCISNENFEDDLMHKIEIRNQVKKSVVKNQNISMIFFVIGIALGLIINFILPKINDLFYSGNMTESISLYFQIFFTAFILFYLEKFLKAKIPGYNKRQDQFT